MIWTFFYFPWRFKLLEVNCSSQSSLPVRCVLITDCEPSFAERPDRKESVEWNIKEQIDSSQWINPGLFIDFTEINISLCLLL